MADSEKDVMTPEEKPEEKSMGREILEWIVTILAAFAIAMLIKSFIFTIALVDGESMMPTLNNGDRLVVWRLGYQPQRGDIIVLQQAGKKPYIKRIIAVEGDTVDIDFNLHTVKVNGEILDENYILEPIARSGDMIFPLTVDKDCVFVLGDNRNNSTDSRFSSGGQVMDEDIMGKATIRLFPFTDFGSVYKNEQ